MQRVKTATAIDQKPAYSTDGDPGFFRSGDPVQGLPATVPGQDWFNQVQEEIIHVILGAGLALNAEDDTQLYQAVVALIEAAQVEVGQASETAAGIVELATSTEVGELTDAVRAVTPAGLGSVFAKSLGSNGYQKFPGGMILQWGTVGAVTSSGVTFTFPVTFPTACLLVSVTDRTNQGLATISKAGGNFVSASQGYVVNESAAGDPVNWIAIGH